MERSSRGWSRVLAAACMAAAMGGGSDGASGHTTVSALKGAAAFSPRIMLEGPDLPVVGSKRGNQRQRRKAMRIARSHGRTGQRGRCR